MSAFNRHVSEDFLGGPRVLKLAWAYLALHGTYGYCWLLKHAAFRDPKWETRVTFGGAVMTFLLVLGPYWVFPYLLISDALDPDHPAPSSVLLALCISLHTLGEMMLYASYALLVQHWIPWVILAWVWTGVFLVNMLMKEASLSRYSGWRAYKAGTAMLLPWRILVPRGEGADGEG